jgi:glycosyltransferase involved in cell wall biosynthesis
MKILYVTTVSSTTNFFFSHVNMLIDQGHSVDFACNVNKPINQSLLNRGCRVFQIDFSRSPLDLSNMRAYKGIKSLIIREKFDIVHVHTPVAAAVTRLAIKNIPNIKVIYTAHGFHFYKGAPLKNWLLYYPVEKYLSKHTDVLITINQEDYERAKHKFKAKQIEYVPGVGIDINKFQNVAVDKEKKRAELGITKEAYVMLSVGELNENKNHSTVIRALKRVNNPNITYMICGQGPLEEKLKDLIKELGLRSQVKLLGFRSDIPEILKISDLFVFPSRREGLSVSLMEAMMSGLPIVCSKIRGNTDLVEEGKGGYLVKPNDIDGYAESIVKMVDDRENAVRFVEYNKERIVEFSDERVQKLMEKIYTNLLL